MLQPDPQNKNTTRRNERHILLLVILFGGGQFLNLAFQRASIGSFGTNDLVDAWTLLVCIYAAAVTRRCIAVITTDAPKIFGTSEKFRSAMSFLSVSALATIALAVTVAAIFRSGVLECVIVIGVACEVIAVVVLMSIGFGGGFILGNKLTSFVIAVGMSFIGSGVLIVHQSTANLGVVLPAIVLLGRSARDSGKIDQS